MSPSSPSMATSTATASNTAAPWLAHLERIGPWVRPVLGRLPMQPPSAVLAHLLTERWWPKVPLAVRHSLCGRRVDVIVQDLGLHFRLRADGRGLFSAASSEPMAVSIQADARAFIDLLEGREDPDTLFFERRLVMEGDTAFALLLKNTLDAVGPVEWRPWRSPRAAA
ncbi:MAG: SCP2 sterol-binding domain-containing protein [Aquabacterium sp.]